MSAGRFCTTHQRRYLWWEGGCPECRDDPEWQARRAAFLAEARRVGEEEMARDPLSLTAARENRLRILTGPERDDDSDWLLP